MDCGEGKFCVGKALQMIFETEFLVNVIEI